MLDEQRIRMLMHDECTGGMPDSLVDLGRLVSDGRQRRRRRHIMAVGAGALVLVVIAGLAVAPRLLSSAGGKAPAEQVAGSAPAVQRVRLKGFEQPLHLRLAPGWLPAGAHTVWGPQMSTAAQSVTYAVGEGDTPESTDVTITLYAPGFQPRWLDPRTKDDPNQLVTTTAAAPPVGTAAAQWFTTETHYKPGEPHTRPPVSGLIWQWQPDAVVTVEGQAPGTVEQNHAIWRHIAEKMQFTGATPVPVDVTVADVPARLGLMAANREHVAKATDTMLIFNDESYVLNTQRTDGTAVHVGPNYPIDPNPTANPKGGPAPQAPELRKVDGRDVYIYRSSTTLTVVVPNVDEHTVTLSSSGGPGKPPQVTVDEAIAMAVSVHILSEQSTWTTNPVRD